MFNNNSCCIIYYYIELCERDVLKCVKYVTVERIIISAWFFSDLSMC